MTILLRPPRVVALRARDNFFPPFPFPFLLFPRLRFLSVRFSFGGAGLSSSSSPDLLEFLLPIRIPTLLLVLSTTWSLAFARHWVRLRRPRPLLFCFACDVTSTRRDYKSPAIKTAVPRFDGPCPGRAIILMCGYARATI